MKTNNGAHRDLLGQAEHNLGCREFCTIVMGWGGGGDKQKHVLLSLNMSEVPYGLIDYLLLAKIQLKRLCWPLYPYDKISKKCKINWSNIDGTSPKPKRLHSEKDETDQLYHCPIQVCDHDSFQSQRRCRKHVYTKHSWLFYFNEKRDLRGLAAYEKEGVNDVKLRDITVQMVGVLPSFSVSSKIGESFAKWLTGSGGGCKKVRVTQQIVKRCFKFFKFCCEDEEELSFEVLDFSLCSHSLLFKFIDYLQDECKLVHGGPLGSVMRIEGHNWRVMGWFSLPAWY